MTTTLSKTVFFAAQPDTVWEFLTNKEKLGLWYHPAKKNLADGEDYALLSKSDDGTVKTLIWGRVVEMTPPSKLARMPARGWFVSSVIVRNKRFFISLSSNTILISRCSGPPKGGRCRTTFARSLTNIWRTVPGLAFCPPPCSKAS